MSATIKSKSVRYNTQMEIEPTDGLRCGICGGRMYLAKDEPDYRMCECDGLRLLGNWIKSLFQK